MRTYRAAMLLLVAGLCTAGCGKLRDAAFRQKTANDLKRLCELYGTYYAARGYGPAGVSDLEPLVTGDDEARAVLDAVQSGHYVLLWKVDVHAVGRTRPGMAFTVLGYERQVPESGGQVLMVDGSVLEMKPAKFAAAQKGNALDEAKPR